MTFEEPTVSISSCVNSRHRPLLQGGEVLPEIQKLLEARKPYYAEADFFFETDGKTSTQVAEMILAALGAGNIG